jgi:hypothetical protein
MSTLGLWRRGWCVWVPIALIGASSIANAQFPGFGPGMPGMRGPMGGGPGPRPFGPFGPFGPGSEEIHYFYCANCNGYVGSGKSANDKHQFAKCPHCGVTFSNTFAGMKEGARQPDAKPNEATPAPTPPNGFGPAENNGNGNRDGFGPPVSPPAASFAPPASPASPTAAAPAAAVPSRSRISLVLIILAAGALVLLVIVVLAAGVIWMLCTAPSAPLPQRVTVKNRRSPNEYDPI